MALSLDVLAAHMIALVPIVPICAIQECDFSDVTLLDFGGALLITIVLCVILWYTIGWWIDR